MKYLLLFLCGVLLSGSTRSQFPFRGAKHDSFDWRLFQTVAKTSTYQNVAISTFSIKLLLSLLSDAADSYTKQQLASVLPTIDEQFYKNVIQSLEQKNSNFEINVGSKVYADASLSPAPTFVEIATNRYHANVDRVKFSNAKETASEINAWVSKLTNGAIKELVEPENVKDYVALLVNVIYFKGTWEKLFPDDDTFPGRFRVNAAREVKTPLMSLEDTFYYLDSTDLGAKLLRLPYKGGKYAMTIILPHNPDGLADLIRNFNPNTLQQLQLKMTEKKVNIELPKFSFKSSLSLKQDLIALGLGDIFTRKAQLPGLGQDLEISDVIQKAGVIVDEKGTEIEAASGVSIGNRFGSIAEIFRATHPFLFLLEDETTGAPLFIGTVADPTA
uniref:Venom polypeptide n=1 Tax=Dolopus genitalis TaxID=2488630 RepID=A0A3G5BIG6_DOLGE|nr:venom polypeptide [Dolopus genitalis]